MKGRWFLRGAQVLATLLFVTHLSHLRSSHWISWLIPMALIILIVVNSLRFTRFVSWIIFAVSFFSFLILLSAFTLRWRLEMTFDASPFYVAIMMYVLFIYVSLAQIKILGKEIKPSVEDS